MKLPQNKQARLGINFGFCIIWFIVGGFLSGMTMIGGVYLPGTTWIPLGLQYLIILSPMVLVTKYIWTGHWSFKRTVEIRGRLEEEQAGKKWDAVVDELMNRK